MPSLKAYPPQMLQMTMFPLHPVLGVTATLVDAWVSEIRVSYLKGTELLNLAG